MNEEEFEKTWNEYYPKVYGYFFRRVSQRTDVEDLTSTTLSVFYQKHIGTTITNPNAYLWKIAHFQLLAYIKNKSKSPIYVSIEENFTADSEIDSQKSDYLISKKSDIKTCISQYATEEEREIIEYIIIDEKSSQDVASILGLKADSVRQKLHRAIKKLRLRCLHIWNT